MSRARLQELSLELDAKFKEIKDLLEEHRGLSIYLGNDKNRYEESVGLIIDAWEPRLDWFRGRLSMIHDIMPKKWVRRTKD